MGDVFNSKGLDKIAKAHRKSTAGRKAEKRKVRRRPLCARLSPARRRCCARRQASNALALQTEPARGWARRPRRGGVPLTALVP